MVVFQNLLLANINQLEDKEEEEESLLSSNLPLTSDKNYMKLSVEDEQDMMDEMDREMGALDLKPDSPRVHLQISKTFNFLECRSCTSLLICWSWPKVIDFVTSIDPDQPVVYLCSLTRPFIVGCPSLVICLSQLI